MKITTGKIIVFIVVLLLAIILGAGYGIAHDQLTYTISPEFYTKYMFYQFGLWDEAQFNADNHRGLVSMVGVMSTWWVGLIIGVVLGAIGMRQTTWQRMLGRTVLAMLLAIFIAALVGLGGLLYGFLTFPNLSPETIIATVPEDVIGASNFYIVSRMHNFSYAGGAIGLLVAGVWGWRQRA